MPTTIDDFEDGDISVSPANWSGWSGSTGDFTAQAGTVLAGTYSGELYSDDSGGRQVNTTRDTATTDGVTLLVRANKDTQNPSNNNAWSIRFNRNSGTQLGDLQFQDGGLAVVWEGSTVLSSWSPDTTYNLGFDFDFGADEVTIYVDQTNEGTYALANSASGLEDIEVRNNAFGSGTSRLVFVDDVAVTNPPGAPANLTVDDTVEDELTLNWDAGSDADQHTVYRAQSSGSATGDYTAIATVDGSTTTYTDTGLADGERYYYRVTASNGFGESGVSGEADAVTVLPAPTTLTVDAVRDTEADLSWVNNHDNGSVTVQQKPADTTTWTDAATGLSLSTESETLTGLRNGEQYDARVLAVTEHATTEDT